MKRLAFLSVATLAIALVPLLLATSCKKENNNGSAAPITTSIQECFGDYEGTLNLENVTFSIKAGENGNEAVLVDGQNTPFATIQVIDSLPGQHLFLFNITSTGVLNGMQLAPGENNWIHFGGKSGNAQYAGGLIFMASFKAKNADVLLSAKKKNGWPNVAAE